MLQEGLLVLDHVATRLDLSCLSEAGEGDEKFGDGFGAGVLVRLVLFVSCSTPS